MSSPDLWDFPALEASLWSASAVVATVAYARSPKGGRLVWALISLACVCFVLDKTIDLNSHIMRLGRDFVHFLDPENHFRGDTLYLRVALLGLLFVAGCAGIKLVMRFDRAIGAAKLCALAGIVVVMALLAARLIPRFGFLVGGAGKVVEILAWMLVTGGTALGIRRTEAPPPPPRWAGDY